MVSVNEGNARSVMLIRGPVNSYICLLVGLSEPTDDRKPITIRYRQNFVKCIRGESDEETSFTFQTKRLILIIKIQHAAAVTTVLRFN